MERKCNIQKLNEIIKERGVKKSFIADKLGIAPPRLSEKLTGRVFMYPDEIIQVLQIVGVDVAEERLADWYS